jgi:hypothetical protein
MPDEARPTGEPLDFTKIVEDLERLIGATLEMIARSRELITQLDILVPKHIDREAGGG